MNGYEGDEGEHEHYHAYPIGRRTESDWTADGIRLDGGRKRLNTDYKNIIIRHKEFKRHLKNTPNNPRIPHNFCNFTRVLP